MILIHLDLILESYLKNQFFLVDQ